MISKVFNVSSALLTTMEDQRFVCKFVDKKWWRYRSLCICLDQNKYKMFCKWLIYADQSYDIISNSYHKIKRSSSGCVWTRHTLRVMNVCGHKIGPGGQWHPSRYSNDLIMTCRNTQLHHYTITECCTASHF